MYIILYDAWQEQKSWVKKDKQGILGQSLWQFSIISDPLR